MEWSRADGRRLPKSHTEVSFLGPCAEARPRTPAETGLFKPEVQRWLAAGGRSKFTEGDMLSEGWGAGEMEQMVGE